MNKQISGIISYLLKMNNAEYTDSKYLKVEINDDNKFAGGNIKIDATGTWIKDFCIQSFKDEAWCGANKKIFVHCGDKKANTYEVYNVADNIITALEQEPFVEDCEYYVSFVFDIPKETLLKKFPVIRKYINDIADEHTDIKMEITGSDEYLQEMRKHIRSIANSLTTIMTYDSSNDCTDNFVRLFGVSTTDAAKEKIEKILTEQVLSEQ